VGGGYNFPCYWIALPYILPTCHRTLFFKLVFLFEWQKSKPHSFKISSSCHYSQFVEVTQNYYYFFRFQISERLTMTAYAVWDRDHDEDDIYGQWHRCTSCTESSTLFLLALSALSLSLTVQIFKSLVFQKNSLFANRIIISWSIFSC